MLFSAFQHNARTADVVAPLATDGGLAPGAHRCPLYGGEGSAEISDMSTLFSQQLTTDDQAESDSVQVQQTEENGPASLQPVRVEKREAGAEQQGRRGRLPFIGAVPVQVQSAKVMGTQGSAENTTSGELRDMRTFSNDSGNQSIDFNSIDEIVDEFVDSIVALVEDAADIFKDMVDQITDSIDDLLSDLFG